MRRSLLVMLVLALAAAAVLWQHEPVAAPQLSRIAAPAAAPVAPVSVAPDDVAPPPARSEAPVLPAAEPARDPVARARLLQDRKPLAGVAVVVMLHTTPAREVTRTITADDGTFTFPATELVWLAAIAPEVPRGWRTDWIRPSPIDVDLGDVHVPRGGIVEGIVRGDAQRPLAGARVWVARGEHRRASPADELDDAPVITGADGRFRLERVHPGGNRVRAFAPGYAAGLADVNVLEGEPVSTVIDLTRGGRVTGRVLNWRGEPLPGATVSSGGVQAETDANGAFVLEPFGGEAVGVAAVGHDTHWASGHEVRNPFEVRLDRLVPLRGVVKGHGGKPTTVRIEGAVGDAPAMPGPYSAIDRDLPVAAAGTFEVPGLRMANYVVRATTVGVGASLPLHLQLRDEATIELEIEAQPTLSVSVRDEWGQPILGAEAVLDPNLANYPSLNVDGDAQLLARVLNMYGQRTVMRFDGATVSLLRAFPMAFVVRAKGYLPVVRAFTAAGAPDRIDIVLRRAGTVRGVVRGGSAVAYARTVSMWRVEDDARMRAPPPKEASEDRFEPLSCAVDAAGAFAADSIAPGAYRAAVSRWGTSYTGKRADEQVDAVPLVDQGVDLRAVVDLAVVGGAETYVELDEPPLGTLRGRVLLAGQPFAGAKIVASRPGWKPRPSLAKHADWDDDLHLSWVAGQHTTADGRFLFHYRDAGDVELRVRHPGGASTSTPTLVSLPPPGAPVLCDVLMPAGGIRGRYPIDALGGRKRELVEVVLFPMHKAGLDPEVSIDWNPGIAWGCARMDLPADGVFTFPFLPAGDWLVRIYEGGLSFGNSGFRGRIHWQRVIAVREDVVELGDLVLPHLVPATFEWQWAQGGTRRQVDGVGLFQAHGGNATAVWVHRFALHEQDLAWAGIRARTANVPPGDYVLAPMSFRYRRGYGIAVKVAADGTVTPSVVIFPPAPPEPR